MRDFQIVATSILLLSSTCFFGSPLFSMGKCKHRIQEKGVTLGEDGKWNRAISKDRHRYLAVMQDNTAVESQAQSSGRYSTLSIFFSHLPTQNSGAPFFYIRP